MGLQDLHQKHLLGFATRKAMGTDGHVVGTGPSVVVMATVIEVGLMFGTCNY